jgi:1-acyl-sn-glycerol-3-phosphate acyltransferase
MTILYTVGKALCNLAIHTKFDIKTKGIEKYILESNPDRPAILAPNHVYGWDIPLVGVYTKRELHYLAKEQLFKYPGFGFFLRNIGIIPVVYDKPAISSIKRSTKALDQDQALCVFPEGTRSYGKPVGEFQKGIDLIARTSKKNAEIVPIGIRYEAKTIYMNVGKPLYSDDYKKRSLSQDLQKIVTDLVNEAK